MAYIQFTSIHVIRVLCVCVAMVTSACFGCSVWFCDGVEDCRDRGDATTQALPLTPQGLDQIPHHQTMNPGGEPEGVGDGGGGH